jgi:hypothetical protein
MSAAVLRSPATPHHAPAPVTAAAQSFAVYATNRGQDDLYYRGSYVMQQAAIREAETLVYGLRYPHARVVARWADGTRAVAWDNRHLDEMLTDVEHDIDLYETGRIAGAR